MLSTAADSTDTDFDLSINDLGPLAWVLEELRKSLDGSAKALKRFVRDTEAVRGSDLATIDASQLRIARQQLHQAVGALEMVGLTAPALVLRAMEAAVQRFVQHPEHCTPDAATKMEHASFALTEYLEAVLADKPISPVALFPQYREIQLLIKADRIHPADLWPHEWRWLEPAVTTNVEPQEYGATARGLLDRFILQIMKGKVAKSAQRLVDVSLGFAAAHTERQPRIFWKVTAAFFEALGHNLLPEDIYVRRGASRILLQYTSLATGDVTISERLAQDLLFFCSQAFAARSGDTPVLSAVGTVYGLDRFKPVNYETVQFGRFDPALLAQARKRIVSAKETWASLSAGDPAKFKVLVDQFGLVTDSLLKLYPSSEPLAQALVRAIDATAVSSQAPPIGLALEVATSVLYLEAAFDDLDPNDPQLTERIKHLAQRLEKVRAGGEPQPLESWMEDLYRKVSDRQTMGSVVGELRVALAELEKSLDVFFRNPQDKNVLHAVPGQLSQMRGVLSVLGLDQASQAVLHMREIVEQMLMTESGDQDVSAAAHFNQLGNNLGALSFLVDMLNYQPTLAKKLFIYDEATGELRSLMGRVQRPTDATTSPERLSQEFSALLQHADASGESGKLTAQLSALATQAALAGQPELAKNANEASMAVAQRDAPAAVGAALNTLAFSVATSAAVPATRQAEAVDLEEDNLKGIFLEEANEVVRNGQDTLVALTLNPHDIEQLTVLRRVFHTLKGSSRMVGLQEFGEAAWSVEQLFNSWLADQKAASPELLELSSAVLKGFSRWADDIAGNHADAWSAATFRASADAMRKDGRWLALVLPTDISDTRTAAPALQPEVLPQSLPALEFDTGMPDIEPAVVHTIEAIEATEAEAEVNFDDFFSPDKRLTSLESVSSSVETVAEVQGIDFESLSQFSGLSEDKALKEVTSAGVEAEHLEFSDFPVEFDAPVAAQTPNAVDVGIVSELSAADFDNAFKMAPLVQAPAAEVSFVAAAPTFLDDNAVVEALRALNDEVDSPGTPAQAQLVHAETGAAFESSDEQVKVIGTLRIPIPLYNVYLNEADEWSRRLITEVSEWALEQQHPVNDSTVALAHSLAGSSATVGFKALWEIARIFEQALQQSQVHHSRLATAEYASVFVEVAEDIRRLLHQFAAGFLKEFDPAVMQRLRELKFAEVVPVVPSEPLDAVFLVEQPTSDVGSERSVPKQAAQMAMPLAPSQAHAYYTAASDEIKSTHLAVLRPKTYSDDVIDALDAVDPELFPIFDEEAADLMPQLGAALRQWSAAPGNASARMEVLRILHTLKGSARLAGALRLGEMAHHLESEIEFMGLESAMAQDFEALLVRFDAMEHALDTLRNADLSNNTAVNTFTDTSITVPPTPAVTAAGAGSDAPDAHAVSVPIADTLEEEGAVSELLSAQPAAASLPSQVMMPAPQATAMQPIRQAAAASIRVRAQLLDRMVNQAGEVMITRSRLEAELSQLRSSLGDMSGNLNRLRQQLRDVELQAESQMQSRLAHTKETQAGFDPLEFDRFTRVQELTRMMAESVNDVATVQRTLQRTVEATEDDLIAQARQTRELQRDLLRTRMVEFESISDRLYRVVRLASKETAKQVKLDLLGGTIEMDRGMLDRMTPAFEHLLRNCVAHGIESPEMRTQAGKDAVGLITVHLQQDGNDVSVEFSDDGAGLDLQRIREKAISLGLIAADQVLSESDAANLIFMPGFSTASQVTELAGRGIGMDVVRSEINAVGGRIETSTVVGKGTHFKLVLPLTTAVTQVVMVRAGSLSVGVPANMVETVRRTTTQELQQAYSTGTIDVEGETGVPFFWSGALFQSSYNSHEVQAKTTSVVIFRSAAQRVALHVDEVLGNLEVVVKNLGPQLSRLPGLAGMSVLASGAVVLIYNPVALASVYGQQARELSAHPEKSPTPGSTAVDGRVMSRLLVPTVSQVPLVLVVDDSITVRRVTQRLLQREGYRVAMAADGLQALERLQEELPAVVLSDIEMPRMDGFDLVRNIRADARLRSLPIIMITSRIAEKHREHAQELGVDHYLGKPYSEEQLMSLVRSYCNLAAPVTA